MVGKKIRLVVKGSGSGVGINVWSKDESDNGSVFTSVAESGGIVTIPDCYKIGFRTRDNGGLLCEVILVSE